MPFSLKTLQKLNSHLKSETLSDLEAKAVSEKVGYKKDSVITTLEAQKAGFNLITEQAKESMKRLKALQNCYQDLSSQEILDWITAVDAVDMDDSPQEKIKVAQKSVQSLQDHVASSKEALENENLDFEVDFSLIKESKQLRKTVEDRFIQAQNQALSDLDMAASLEHENNRILSLQTFNDQTTGSLTSMIAESLAILPGSCPFLLAVLSRKNDYYGFGSMGMDPSSDGGIRFFAVNAISGIVANAPSIYQLVTGNHDNSTNLTGFYTPPHLEFLQGSKGSFSLQKLYTRYKANESVYQYPYAAVGIFYLQNTTAQNLTIPLVLEGSADSPSYGAGVLMQDVSEETWTPLYTLQQSHPNFGINVEIPVLAHQRMRVMVITTATPFLTSDSLVSQFLSLTFSGFRLQPGIRMDIPSLISTFQGGL